MFPAPQLPPLRSADGAIPGKTFPRRMGCWSHPSLVGLTFSYSVLAGNAMGKSKSILPSLGTGDLGSLVVRPTAIPAKHPGISQPAGYFPSLALPRSTPQHQALGQRSGPAGTVQNCSLRRWKYQFPLPRAGGRSLSIPAQSPQDHGSVST